MADIYTDFAYIYDDAMEEIPYAKWGENVHKLLLKNKIKDGLVCELGCGTGTFTRLLKDKGYDMIGIDMSEDMLELAMYAETEDEEEEDAFDPDDRILYLLQDIREFELFGTVKAFVAVCDTMNYLTDRADFVKTLKLVNNYLEKDGLFIFDLKTEYMYKNVIGNTNRSEVCEDYAYIWENAYDESDRTNTYLVTIFNKEDDGADSRYVRSEETHVQKAYTIDEVKSMINEAGLGLVEVLDADTMQAPSEKTGRLYFVVREQFQEGKYYE